MKIDFKAFQKTIENGEELLGRPLTDEETKLLALGFLHGENNGLQKGQRRAMQQAEINRKNREAKEEILESLLDMKQSIQEARANIEHFRGR